MQAQSKVPGSVTELGDVRTESGVEKSVTSNGDDLMTESIKLLKNYDFLESKLVVYVVSVGGWAWAITWAQLGVRTVICVPLTPKAEELLDEVTALPALLGRLRKELAILPEALRGSVLSAHFAPPRGETIHAIGFQKILAIINRPDALHGAIRLFYFGPGQEMQRQARAMLGTSWQWQTLLHRHLGGLTRARVVVGWSGSGQGDHVITPQKRRNPTRPLGRFLEPSAKLARWSTRSARPGTWNPFAENAQPYPWPWSSQEPWVVAPTVYFPGRFTHIQRPMSQKELGQLVDVREDWGSTLVTLLWGWDGGQVPPLRILGETVMALLDWIKAETSPNLEAPGQEHKSEVIDWGRVRAPWVGAPSDSTCLERMAYFGWVWGARATLDVAVATRDDDAGVDLSLWAVGGPDPDVECARGVIRGILFRWWIRRTRREAQAWLCTSAARPELRKNTEGIRDCIRRLANSTWWDWSDGSRLLFWRWPSYWLQEARDGAEGLHFGVPAPRMNFPQPPISEAWVLEKDMEKLEKLLRRRYIVTGPCRNTVPRFPVPKGTTDIRVVWDLRKNGLNEQMYTPSFFLPVMNTYLRRLTDGAFCGDFDIGEQFHNYNLHDREQAFCGVHIPLPLVEKLQAEGLVVEPVMRWDRLVFGWQSSPLLALRMLARALELVKRPPDDPTSAFSWDRVELNLPGAPGYDPGKPRVICVHADGSHATMLVIYFDDGRVMAATFDRALRGLRQATAGLQHLGNQDAARKRRPVSQTPGAWAGGIAYTDQGLIRKFVSQKKWERAKEFIHWVGECCDSEQLIERKRFRSGKGFLLHIAQTYDFMQPHLKGLHLAEEAWRHDRGPDGWKKAKAKAEFDEVDYDHDPEPYRDLGIESSPPAVDEQAPLAVDKIDLLATDIRALHCFFEPDTPVQVIVRPVQGAKFVIYGAGDASGEGFGSAMRPLGMQPLLRHGFWCTESSEQTSNWRELRNLIDAIQVESDAGRLVGSELWIATDNSTAALAYYKGSSSSEKLQDMVVELRKLTLNGNFILHMFHIAGTRMIEIGVDGLSRGEFQLGALAATPSSAAPLHVSALERSPGLRDWLSSWLDEDFIVATPGDWLYRAHQGGQHFAGEIQSELWVWDLPPAAALYALEELGAARLKRHEILRGLVLVPNLLSHEWRQRLTKGTDFHFTIPAGAIPEWPAAMHEALTVGVYLPLFRYRPWDWKRVPFVVPMGITVSKMYAKACYKTQPGTDFLVYHPESENGDVLLAPGEERDFLEARPGDHLFCPFECDGCCFFRLRGEGARSNRASDTLLLGYIRRANLDAFWSRRPGTIQGLVRLFKEQRDFGELFEINMFGPMGPFSVEYDSGIKAAVGVLARSQKAGRNEAKMSYQAARKARTLHTDVYGASAKAVEGAMVWRSDRTRMVATEAPTDSAWFTAFMTGFKARVGVRIKQDAALSVAIMVAKQRLLESEWKTAEAAGDLRLQREVAENAAFFLFLFCGSLRGFEGPMIMLAPLRGQIVSPDSERARHSTPHVGLPLSGRFKARSQEHQHILIPIAYETQSGLEPGKWALRLIQTLELLGITAGWVFQDINGDQRSMSSFSEKFLDLLLQVQAGEPELFPETVNIVDDYHLGRSHRRGATTRATAAGVSESDIEWINRWNVGADQAASGPMRVLYSDRVQLIDTFLRFSSAL